VLLSFRCGGLLLALPLGQAREVLQKEEIVALPECRRGVRGIIVREGVAVPVIDLPALTGTVPGGEADELVIVDGREMRLALLAEETGTDAGGEESEPGESPPEGWGFLRRRVEVGGRKAWRLDPDELAGALGVGPGPEERS
jgi:chemotaxis signal transduction protein